MVMGALQMPLPANQLAIIDGFQVQSWAFSTGYTCEKLPRYSAPE